MSISLCLSRITDSTNYYTVVLLVVSYPIFERSKKDTRKRIHSVGMILQSSFRRSVFSRLSSSTGEMSTGGAAGGDSNTRGSIADGFSILAWDCVAIVYTPWLEQRETSIRYSPYIYSWV